MRAGLLRDLHRVVEHALAALALRLEDRVEGKIPPHLDHMDGHDLRLRGLSQGDRYTEDLDVHARARERHEDAFQLHGSRESTALNPRARAVRRRGPCPPCDTECR